MTYYKLESGFLVLNYLVNGLHGLNEYCIDDKRLHGETRENDLIVLTQKQAESLERAKKAGATRIEITPNLGLSTIEVKIEPEGVYFPGRRLLSWADVTRIRKSNVGCFQLLEDGIEKIQAFSQLTQRPVSLMPTEGAPTMLLAGFPMHRIKGIEPMQDTYQKIKALKPRGGEALDTTTGLGYTAIELAKCVDRVTTIELDPAVVEVARLNPWSQMLFQDPGIKRMTGDAYELIEEFDASCFDWILHDPPTFSLAGDLYSRDFYQGLLRVLKPGGKLFHYVGDLHSRSGRSVGDGVARRLQEVGFIQVKRHYDAFGFVARKET
jgi:predicted methyltransferase